MTYAWFRGCLLCICECLLLAVRLLWAVPTRGTTAVAMSRPERQCRSLRRCGTAAANAHALVRGIAELQSSTRVEEDRGPAEIYECEILDSGGGLGSVDPELLYQARSPVRVSVQAACCGFDLCHKYIFRTRSFGLDCDTTATRSDAGLCIGQYNACVRTLRDVAWRLLRSDSTARVCIQMHSDSLKYKCRLHSIECIGPPQHLLRGVAFFFGASALLNAVAVLADASRSLRDAARVLEGCAVVLNTLTNVHYLIEAFWYHAMRGDVAFGAMARARPPPCVRSLPRRRRNRRIGCV